MHFPRRGRRAAYPPVGGATLLNGTTLVLVGPVRSPSTLVLVFSTVAVVGLTATAAHAGGGFLPPAKLDVGTIAVSDRHGDFAMGTSLLVGLNWATLYPKRTGFDIGIGYVGTFLPEPESRYLARGGDPVAPSQLASAHGGYLEVSLLANERKHMRTWISGRGELLESNGQGGLGMATRVSTELWGGILAGAGNGGIVGVFAIGLWAELGVRELPNDGLARQLSMGISGRLPFVIVGN